MPREEVADRSLCCLLDFKLTSSVWVYMCVYQASNRTYRWKRQAD